MSDSAPPSLAPGARPAPGYEVLAHLTRTGWLDVYDAWSEERACRCVIKLVRPDRLDEDPLRERLLREGRWLREFTHPHLVRAYETFESPEPLVVLETLTGETLSHLIGRLPRRPTAADVALLGVQLCSAVHYLHGQGLLHLDLKPSNVVVDCGHAKVLDLSVARPPGDAPAGLGTFCYLAPEQARGGPLTAAADVWGIGITLYEVACGDVPFDCGGTVDEPYESCDSYDGERADRYPQLERSAPSITARRRLPTALAAAVDGCLRADPASRPTVAELAAALDATSPGPRALITHP
ncbi:serine/threonine-protein kinase [Streptomyces diastatochromogenes]|uniref:non-specific serine/threonine protein kinase n=1 Tax=Streptomyces diastatochromogenes TaxID=42236 RepID=A0A233SKV8_STRDA|nr:serine/threonine-protein kinase [Streptomyces diastatochromogenes]MCZ0990123.1 serine/threonine-protein kinase [Streptomyces diastatochromogenes]OXY96293.1 serine/threonine protein kinase [Streptomyces diastatochromogenes]